MSNGVITIEIDGTPRTFRFSMLCMQIFAETNNVDITGLEGVFNRIRSDMRIMGSILYAAAKAHCEINELTVDFKPAECLEWIGLMEQKQLEDLLTCLAESKYIKNAMGAQPAPQIKKAA